jgi:hypothetical protein
MSAPSPRARRRSAHDGVVPRIIVACATRARVREAGHCGERRVLPEVVGVLELHTCTPVFTLAVSTHFMHTGARTGATTALFESAMNRKLPGRATLSSDSGAPLVLAGGGCSEGTGRQTELRRMSAAASGAICREGWQAS